MQVGWWVLLLIFMAVESFYCLIHDSKLTEIYSFSILIEIFAQLLFCTSTAPGKILLLQK